MQKIFKRMQRLDELIKLNETGTPSELAQRLGISERSIYDYLKLMKTFGAPIQYSRTEKSYAYEQDGSFNISFISKST